MISDWEMDRAYSCSPEASTGPTKLTITTMHIHTDSLQCQLQSTFDENTRQHIVISPLKRSVFCYGLYAGFSVCSINVEVIDKFL